MQYTTEVFGISNFSQFDPLVINSIYGMDPLNIQSEDMLVTKLDEYIAAKIERVPDIVCKLQPAINNIRTSIVTKEVIMNCKFLSEKEKRAFSTTLKRPAPDSSCPPCVKRPRKKFTLLTRLPMDMIAELHRKYTDQYCWKCKKPSCKAIKCPALDSVFSYLKGKIYPIYQHTRLEEYSDKHIRIILDVLKADAQCKKSISDFKKFGDYNLYL